ncbi:cytochrome c oxidase assembly factor Coa1 family protein [Pontimicrobium sp. SW4]|uniref:Cytochrome c oxidase assembly factor Coa1 family protein n=1 Tax=Pontimicrobium sp. SW4 TaxID=3153519 RepID=A0AAU7BSQ8_9FLAO
MEEIKQKSWFDRNWPWLIPVGGCLTIILLFVFGIGAIIFGVSSAITNSTPYTYAVEQASNSPEVMAILGEDIDTNGIMQGNISLEGGDSGHVDITIPIKGLKGKGSVTIKGEKVDGEWIYEKLYVLIKEGKEKINLLDKVLDGV